ncbi:MAG TPA: hypothetical protein VHU80_02635, partial [Polyangiaceae bacterium]|nr:hypothetical protein [Polyangiaceae bacterium]
MTCGCHREPAGKVAPPPAFTRGELVVVERAAADFFEARVLSVSKESLKLQTTAEGDPVTVALNDAYRLPKAPQVFLPGSSAICGAAPSRWVPCKVIHSGATAMEVELANGDRRSLAAERLIRPGPVTVLDIDRHFELLAARKRFGETALAAGHPRRPSGWRPVPHEPILARRGHDWYAAHAVQLLADGGESVVWETSGRAEALPGSYV